MVQKFKSMFFSRNHIYAAIGKLVVWIPMIPLEIFVWIYHWLIHAWLSTNPRPGQNNVSIRTNISHNPMERNLGTVPNREGVGVTGGWMVGEERFIKCGPWIASLPFFKGLLLKWGFPCSLRISSAI